METLVRNHIVKHMRANKIFSPKQYGFISGRSTTLQLLAVLDQWTEALDQGMAVDVIYMDFQKAFDTVPHQRLLGKLKSYGISDPIVNWVSSFLVGRQQKVTINGNDSKWLPVTSGIPQGSVLGPLLFVIFINDLPDNLDSDAYMFADDTKVYRIITAQQDTLKLQCDVCKLEEWSAIWLVGFNGPKCVHMHIGRVSPELAGHSYNLHGETLKTVQVEKDIGVEVDAKLSFESHITTKVNKANQMFGLIRRTFQFLDSHMFAPLYKALVRSHLDFASSVWAPYMVKHVELIEKVQRRATKQIPELKGMTYPERLRKLRLPTLSFRRLRGDLIEVYKILNGVYDTAEVAPVVKLWKDMAPRSGTRGHSKKLYPQQAKTQLRKNSFALRVVKFWNELPESIVSAPSTNSFKNQVDKFYSNHELMYDNYKWMVGGQ